jgi:hypothetical protein
MLDLILRRCGVRIVLGFKRVENSSAKDTLIPAVEKSGPPAEPEA